MSAVALRLGPKTIGDILDTSLTLFLRRPVLFLTIHLIQLVPFLIFQLQFPEMMQPTDPASQMAATFRALPYLALIMVIQFLLRGLLVTLDVQVVGNLYLGHPIAVGQIMRRAVRLMPRMLFVMLVTGLVVGVAVVPCMVFIIIPILGPFICLFLAAIVVGGLAALLALGPTVCVLEDRPSFPGLARSIQLMKWSPVLRMWGLWIMIYVCAEALVLPATFLLPATTTILVTGFSALVMAIVINLATVLLYFDLRVRREGFDLVYLSQLATT